MVDFAQRDLILDKDHHQHLDDVEEEENTANDGDDRLYFEGIVRNSLVDLALRDEVDLVLNQHHWDVPALVLNLRVFKVEQLMMTISKMIVMIIMTITSSLTVKECPN